MKKCLVFSPEFLGVFHWGLALVTHEVMSGIHSNSFFKDMKIALDP